MKPNKVSDKALLDHMPMCIDRIESYIRFEREWFFGSTLIQDGVIRNLQTLPSPAKLDRNHPEHRARDRVAADRGLPQKDQRSC
ncbi:MAG: hypothetical protein ACREWG_11035 [Gammaproteobacteria bacterium]